MVAKCYYSPFESVRNTWLLNVTTLPLRVLNISYLSESITFEISIATKVCGFIHLYISPSQTQDEFQMFKSNLIIAMRQSIPYYHFNAKSKDWCSIDITSFEGSKLDFLTTQFGLSQRTDTYTR